MIYRDEILVNHTFLKGDLAKDCTLVDCKNLDFVFKDNCKIQTTKETKKGKK